MGIAISYGIFSGVLCFLEANFIGLHNVHFTIVDSIEKCTLLMYDEDMDDTKKMLQTIINGQSAMKSELLREIQKLDKKVDSEIGSLKTDIGSLRRETKEGFEKLTARVDKIGLQAARLEDDTPTRDEFDDVDSRLRKLEQN